MPPSSHHQLWAHKHSLQLISHQVKSYSDYPQMQVVNRSAFTAPVPEGKASRPRPGDVYWVVTAVLSAICLIGFVSIIAWLVLRNRMSRSHSDWYIVTTGKDPKVMKEAKLDPVSAISTSQITGNTTESSANQADIRSNDSAQHLQGQNMNRADMIGYDNGPRYYQKDIASDDMTDNSLSTTKVEKISLSRNDHSHGARITAVDSFVKPSPRTTLAQHHDPQADVCHVAIGPDERTNDIDFLIRLYQLLPRLPSQAIVSSTHESRPSCLRRSCTAPAHFNGIDRPDNDKQAGLVSPEQHSTGERESITSTLLQMLVDNKDPNEPYLMDETLPPPSIIVSPPTGSTLSLQRKGEPFY